MNDRMVVEFYQAMKFRMVILEVAEKYFLNRSKPGSEVFLTIKKMKDRHQNRHQKKDKHS